MDSAPCCCGRRIGWRSSGCRRPSGEHRGKSPCQSMVHLPFVCSFLVLYGMLHLHAISMQFCALVLAGSGGARPSSSRGKLSCRHQAPCLLVVSLLDCYIMLVSWHVALFILCNASCIDKCIELGCDCRSPLEEPLPPQLFVINTVLGKTGSPR